MANVDREDDLEDLQERLRQGKRLSGKVYTERFREYNRVHTTNFHDDESLDRYLKQE
jgi:rRNA-processing protein FCF1